MQHLALGLGERYVSLAVLGIFGPLAAFAGTVDDAPLSSRAIEPSEATTSATIDLVPIPATLSDGSQTAREGRS